MTAAVVCFKKSYAVISPHTCYIDVNAERNNVRKLGSGTVCIWFSVFRFLRDKDNNGASLLILCGFPHDPQGVLTCCPPEFALLH
jgi:hypothetical protein